MHAHIGTVCRWRSKNHLWEAVHSFHNVGPRDRTQVFKLSSKLLYLVCHLTGLVVNSSTACLLSLLASLATRQAILCSVLMLFYGYQVFTLPMRIPRSFLRFDSTRLGTYLLNVPCTDFPLVSNVKIRKDISRLNGWPADEVLFFLPTPPTWWLFRSWWDPSILYSEWVGRHLQCRGSWGLWNDEVPPN